MCDLMANAPRTMTRRWYHHLRRLTYRLKMKSPRFVFGPGWYGWERN
jgi:hypothetical protein